MKYVLHFGHNNSLESGVIQRYASNSGYSYRREGLRNEIFKTATLIKHASMAVIWNGLKAGAPLATRICRRRGIPVCYLEWGLLPQATTFLVDPYGFCGDSILAKDVSWVTKEDLKRLQEVRRELQKQYPVRTEGHVLAPLQIENDTQVLFFSPYRKMEEFIEDVESMYPNNKIIVRPHPKASKQRSFARAEVRTDGDFLSAASKASVVIGITSTCLYEAAILGVPVVALGDHPLRIQPKHLHEKVLAGILALRIDRTTGDMATVVNRFGIRPL